MQNIVFNVRYPALISYNCKKQMLLCFCKYLALCWFLYIRDMLQQIITSKVLLAVFTPLIKIYFVCEYMWKKYSVHRYFFPQSNLQQKDIVRVRIMLALYLKCLALKFTLRTVEDHPPCSLSNVN